MSLRFFMRRPIRGFALSSGVTALLLAALFRTGHSQAATVDVSKLPPAASVTVDFVRDIKPILESSCVQCHGPEKAKGKFLLDTREHALKGGDNGVDIVPGDSAKSPLVHFAARVVEDSEMPPVGKGKPLSKEQVGLLRAWIDQGVIWPDGLALQAPQEVKPGTPNAQQLSAALPPPAGRQVDFVKDIQPILSSHCYECHGAKKQEAQFRLDVKEIALKGGELGIAIVPGKSAESLLIQAVAGARPDLIMPKKGERLSTEQIGLLRTWIDQGANWPENASVQVIDKRNHWAFKAPVRPAVPSTKRTKWARNPIDSFVLARLEKEKLRPSPEADRATLIRRLSLDLTGLPPSIKEVKEFVADRRPDAYERLVELLLASPHYGERWGRHWLDLARYADTNGYEKDKPRSIWPYRDWIIKAFNRDMPYDEFTIEQLAGDLLPESTLDQRVATGFLRNSMLNQEGGIEPEQFRVEALIDRMDTLGKTFLGLTINCCQCHNHKYDPFPQQEYYQLYAFLNNDDEAFLEVPTPEQEKQRKEILAKVRRLQETAMQETTNLTERMAAWEKTLAEATNDWVTLDPKDWQNFATKFEKQDDGSLLGGGDLQQGGVMRVSAETALTNITGFQLEALTNPNLMYGGPGLVGKGSFLIKEFTVEAFALDQPTVTNKVKFRRALADEEAPGFSVTNAIDGNTDKGGWSPALTPDHRNRNHRAVFECEEPISFPAGTRLQFTIHETMDGDTKLDCHMLGCLRLSATTKAAPLTVDPLSSEQRKWLAIPAEKLSPEQRLALFDIFRVSDPAFAGLNKQIAQACLATTKQPANDASFQTRRSRATRSGSARGCSVGAEPVSSRRASEPPRARAMARGPPQSHDGASDGQSHVAELFWPGSGHYAGGLRDARGHAFSSRVARLAGV